MRYSPILRSWAFLFYVFEGEILSKRQVSASAHAAVCTSHCSRLRELLQAPA